jgi:HAD superfamily hydrolase (TIGR01484 family)
VELIVFDLDGTLLNQESEISDYTSETLKLLADKEIAYTVATGRALHSARAILEGHQFKLPQAYKNGVVIWHPEQMQFSSGALLTPDELDHIVHACIHQKVTPFVFTLEESQENFV